MVNGPEGGLEWDAVNWRTHEKNVARLRRRIFTAVRDGDWPAVRNLQKMMVRHEALLFRMEVEDLDLPAVVAVG